MGDLLGLSPDLDAIIQDFAFLATVHWESHPANAGDVSQVLPNAAAHVITEAYAATASDWFDIARIEQLATLRADGRVGYRSEGISNPRYYDLVAPIANRMILITRTGAQIPALRHTIDCRQDGLLLNVIHVDSSARRLRIVYGHREYGSIPSIETHVHLLANAVSVAEGLNEPAMVHAHPPNLVSLGRHPLIRGSFERFNAAVYTSVEGLNRNYTGLIGVVPYRESGTKALVDSSIDSLVRHRLVLWMNHGFVVRESNIRRAYSLLGYAEDAARAALFTLTSGALGLPTESVLAFLEEHQLLDAYRSLGISTA